VDTYSFSILLWQILRLETPFEGFSVSMFEKKVVQGGARPAVDPKWPSTIIELMQKGWSDTINERPSMEEVANVLRDEINRNSDEEVNEIMDASRKSEMSLHNGNK
jgi:serine/threonine protein kinase